MTQVFISWSGEVSQKLAEELRKWIPAVLQFTRPYFTPNDIEKGAKWSAEISKSLSECQVGIICLTKDNHSRPWILFEAGALSKGLDSSKVCTLLFDLEPSDVSGPLTTFQATKFEKDDFKKLIASINDSGGDYKLQKEVFEQVFEMWWPRLEEAIKKALETGKTEKTRNIRSERELIEETLDLVRGISRTTMLPKTAGVFPNELARELVDSIESIMDLNRKLLSSGLNDCLAPLLRAASYVSRRSVSGGEELDERLASLRQQHEIFIPF